MKPQNTSSTNSGSRIQRNSPPSKKFWTIAHACGHEVERDLSDRPADRRAGFAEWLANQECTDCWKATRVDREEVKAAWLAAKRAEEQAAAGTWSAQYRMPPLEGSERGIAWGERCRHQLVSAAYTALVLEGDMDDDAWQQIEDAARTITRAGWWIDNRASEPDDLPELLAAATSGDRPCENPFV
ncbi:hypothetical protein [Streptantibioticus ferralitis]|uniref:Uncharacterized protein n=1 Tax=Streptantibioticus ferralitis TaxID=236510 RepID=A0ABT5YSJ1_9ACTN|nr:hypothetical protein [Streptantibioticus ferralitis]MDF2254342.1 hypothetical protein [Streptantibioticus ferralitis]